METKVFTKILLPTINYVSYRPSFLLVVTQVKLSDTTDVY